MVVQEFQMSTINSIEIGQSDILSKGLRGMNRGEMEPLVMKSTVKYVVICTQMPSFFQCYFYADV